MKNLVFVRTIEVPTETASDFDIKRNLVNHIESYGFICKFVPGAIEVYAEKNENLWDMFKMLAQ